MSSTARRTVLAGALAGGVLALAPVAAFAADDSYAPTVPVPTVSGVAASTTPPAGPEVASTTAGNATAGDTSVASSGAALPRTGADVLVWTITGGALIVGGSTLVAASRRRHQH